MAAAARAAWADGARGKKWTLWTRLSWAWSVSEYTASKHIEHWARQCQTRVPGSSMLIGLHQDTSRRHAHALIFVPRRWWDISYPPGIGIVGEAWAPWLRWRHGDVWAVPYAPGRTARTTRGAVDYLAKDPGAVMVFGTPPAYRPQRKR